MNTERNTCAFCRAVTEVSRQYLHAKNKPLVGDGFDFMYYCNDCGLFETVEAPTLPSHPTTENKIEEMKVEINTRLWYALGDIEPTEEKMTRAVESMYEYLKSYASSLLQEMRKEVELLTVSQREEFKGGLCSHIDGVLEIIISQENKLK